MYIFLTMFGVAIIVLAIKSPSTKVTNDEIDFKKALDREEEKLENKFFENQIKDLSSDINDCLIRLQNIEDSITFLKEDFNIKIEDLFNFEGVKVKTLDMTENGVTNIDEKKTNQMEDLNYRIQAMYNDGYSLEDICIELGIGKGEALLRLGLNKKNKV